MLRLFGKGGFFFAAVGGEVQTDAVNQISTLRLALEEKTRPQVCPCKVILPSWISVEEEAVEVEVEVEGVRFAKECTNHEPVGLRMWAGAVARHL